MLVKFHIYLTAGVFKPRYSGTMAIEMRQQPDIWKSLEQAVKRVRNF